MTWLCTGVNTLKRHFWFGIFCILFIEKIPNNTLNVILLNIQIPILNNKNGLLKIKNNTRLAIPTSRAF